MINSESQDDNQQCFDKNKNPRPKIVKNNMYVDR